MPCSGMELIMQKVGIMGGTFNPIHLGHLMLAESAREEFALDEIWLLPTGCSYMKRDAGVLEPEERFFMASLAAADNEKMRCLDIEIKRCGYTYSYETMEALKKLYPETEFSFLMGADCLFTMESWKHPERLLQCCRIIAAVRDDASFSEMEEKRLYLMEKYHADIVLFSFRQIAISSTDIRERVRLGKSIRYLVPDKVLAYIEEKGFYKDENSYA